MGTQDDRLAAGAGNRTDAGSDLGEDSRNTGLAIIDDDLATRDDGLAIKDDGLAAEINNRMDVDNKSDARPTNQMDGRPDIGKYIKTINGIDNSLDYNALPANG